jgi:hypothetical protein
MCRYRGIEPVITRELLDAACSAYFVDDTEQVPVLPPRKKAPRPQMDIH